MIPYFRPKLFISLILIALISGLPSVSQAQSPFVLDVDFSAAPTSGIVPLTVTFSDESTGDPTGWAWYFGDEDFSGDWTQVTASAAWSDRYHFTSIVFPDGSIVMMGGRDEGGYKNDVWRSMDGGTSWTQVTASAPWSARVAHSSVLLPDGSIVLMGGEDMSSIRNDVWRSTDGGLNWTMLTGNAEWSVRENHTSVVLPDGSIILMGGIGGYLTPYNDVWRSTDNGATWTQLTANAPWSARFQTASVVLLDGSIVLMGGSKDLFGQINDVWRSLDGGQNWTLLTDNAEWSGRIGHTSVVAPDGSIVLMGGYDGTIRKNDVWRSVDQGASWTELTGSVGWSGRLSHRSEILPDGSIVIMGGSTGMGTRANDVWRLETAGSNLQNPEHTYTETGLYSVALQAYKAASNARSHKIGYIHVYNTPVQADFSAAPTKGIAPLKVQFSNLSTGAPSSWAWYFGDEDYSADWSQAAGSADWAARYDHSSVVLPDGSIVLMGGSDGFWSWTNDVWRSIDGGETWTQMTAHADWSPRIGHSSVVLADGSILLMGGYDAYGAENDVWRSIDHGATWSLVTDSAAWPGRNSHNSLVLPDESILVMGGFLDNGNYTGDVWRSTDNGASWVQMTASAGWPARARFSSVALPDGTILVMGGLRSGGYENDVWQSTDNGATWVQVTADAEWADRGYHTSVVMPDGSIVLMSGYDTSHFYNDAWRSTDNGATWSQLAGSVSGTARYSHTSVVLPDGRIVVMGGVDPSYQYLNDVWQLETAGSNLQNPEHTYASQGTYDVVLSVSGPDSADTETKSDYINVLYDVILPLFFR